LTTWPKDTTAAKNAFYGDFYATAWSDKNLIHIKPPFTLYYEKKPMLKGILVHQKIAPAVMAAMTEIWDACDHDHKKVWKAGASDWGGCFNIRRIAGSNSYSNHSWACALDLSPSTNGFNMKTTLSAVTVKAFKKQGALWGGDYKGRKDPMHFEFVSR